MICPRGCNSYNHYILCKALWLPASLKKNVSAAFVKRGRTLSHYSRGSKCCSIYITLISSSSANAELLLVNTEHLSNETEDDV